MESITSMQCATCRVGRVRLVPRPITALALRGSVVEWLEARRYLSHSHATLAHLTEPRHPIADSSYVVADRLGPHAMVLDQSQPAYTIASGSVVPSNPVPIRQVSGSGAGLHILLEEGPNLRANVEAAAAFQRAVDFIQSIFADPVTIVVDAEISPLTPGIVGQTSSVEYHFDASQYDAVRDLLVNDAVGNEDIVTALPTSAQYNALLPTDTAHPFSIGGLTATRANLLALGMPAGMLQDGPASQYDPTVKRDMSMTFGSTFPFDYNSADGISPGKLDFTGVVEHEIAHGLGFDSEVDNVDYLLNHPKLDRTLYPTTLDLFRLRPGDGAIDFSNSPRVLAPGNVVPNQVFYDGGIFDPAGTAIPNLTVGDIPMSTGQFHGDGNQASHWKDDDGPAGTGVTIGAMDPTTGFGEAVTWTDADTRALGLIGWDVVSRGTITGSVYQDLNGNGRRDPGEPGIPGVQVYIDTNRDGVFEPSERSTFTDALGDYRFDGLTAGDYVVRQAPRSGVAPAAVSPGYAQISLAPGQSASANSLGLVQAATPSPWTGTDISYTPGLTGADAYSNGTFTISGAGKDVGGVGDAFHYVYQTLRGDCSIVAHVSGFQSADAWAKAGIMIRQNLYQNTGNVFLSITRRHGILFSSRKTPGARTGTLADLSSPTWLKLTRAGDRFTTFVSTDGSQWRTLGSQSVRMLHDITIGLAVSSHNLTRLATATFDNVTVSADAPPPRAKAK